MVYKVDQVHVSWQKFLEKSNRPLFESLGQHSMVGVGERVVHNVPGFSVIKLFFVQEDPEQLHSGDCRVSVIELDLVLGGELGPVAFVVLFVASDYVPQ